MRWPLTVALILTVLLPVADCIGAAGPRQWTLDITGTDRVAAGHDYVYTVTLTNDDGAWPSSTRTKRLTRLAFDLTERYGEGTVGIEDILIHPKGQQAPDGTFPCAAQGGCWFSRTGAQVDFTFTKEDVRLAPQTFDVLVHTASVFRPGDSFRVSATLQGIWNQPTPAIDVGPNSYVTAGTAGAAIVATSPLPCGESTDALQPSDEALPKPCRL